MGKIEKQLDSQDVVRWPAKKKYPCKKLKGAHEFEIVKEEDMRGFAGLGWKTVISSVCRGCGKKDLEIIKEETCTQKNGSQIE